VLTITAGAGGGTSGNGGDLTLAGGTVTSGTAGSVIIKTAATERFRAGPAGQLGIAGANYGTSGYVFTSDGSSAAPTWSPKGAIIGTPVASTSGTSIDFTSIPAGVKMIAISLNEVSVSGTAGLLFQLGDSGGVENTGYISSAESGGTVGTQTTGFLSARGAGTYGDTVTYSGTIFLVLENSSAFTWVESGTVTTSTPHIGNSAGRKSLSAELDRVRITTDNGTDTFDAGEVNIMMFF
jgi:hypothetical protein